MSKNIPPLTEFEEEYIATRLMERFRTNCPMLDAQLFLHNEAISVVKRNYRLKVSDNIERLFLCRYLYCFDKIHSRI